ncbi:hypothetical protein THARTR1_00746 [Trichoderma harzianum]|uniref:Uncharacterized protein n=1 Tax=Trichoderma harzianum TaxID=5544 RepID=A0A2K0UP56_TRIHA|nr:hypothetical protein THARTR1_00746 [Trichoderma harzianum]
MATKPPNDYEAEAHDIYLGKNRRLADPVFFPASKRSNHEMRVIEGELAREMESEPDGPREFTKDVMVLWGWGICTRWPPGGPVPRLEDYEKSMDAMTADILNHWKEIQYLVRNHEDAIRDWILRFSPGIENQESRDTNILYAGIQQSWERTVKTFNDCADDIKMFMKSDSNESDFEIDVPNYPEYEKTRRLPFSFMCENFLMGHTHTPPEGRDHYVALYSHPYNYFNDEPDEEPEPCECEILGCQCNDKESREFYRGQRILFLAPHIASCELQDPNCLLSFIHYRGRYHPSVFAKMDNDMTFIGRRTNHLTGPLIPNHMVSFDVSGSDSEKGYHPKLWKGWASRPNPGISGESKEEYDHLWHQGQLFGASEAWIMLQSQRANYHYLRHLLGFIRREAKLHVLPITTPKPPGEQERIFRSSRASMEVIHQRALANWFAFTKQQAFLPPPIQVSPRYVQDLQSKMEVAEKHIQELFSDPGYFFDCINTLKEHHWANIEMQKDETMVNERGLASIYVEKYVEEDYRHILYFDLIRCVLRRSIFEFYMWHAIYTRLQAFQTTMRNTFKDYGKEDDSDTDGIKMLQQPPMFLSDQTKRDHAALAEKYLSLVVLLRYDAVFYINEFRKKGIHAGDHTVFEVAYSVDPPQGEETPSRQSTIQKKHYGAPDLKCRPKFRNQWLRVDEYSADEILRMFFFNSMDNFISDAMNCTNCGITEAAGYLQAMSRAHDPDSTKLIFTDLMDDTIDNLNLLSSLADHLECLWPAMDKVGGAAVDETVRRRYFDLGSKSISINFLDFDDFDFEKKIPAKRLKRLFLFFDELQGFKDESISMGHARGDLKRFGASLLCKFIYPQNNEGRGSKANQEAISRLEKAMGVSGSEYVFNVKETPINLDEIKAGKGAKVQIVSQPSSYRHVAARERDKARERQQERDAFTDAVWVERDHTAEMYKYNPRWMQSLHSTLEQLQLPPRNLVEPLVDALSGISLQSVPKAPDGQPKGIIKKRDWATLEAVYNIHGSANAAVSYAQLKLAMGALGYKEDPSGGSHMRFVRQDGRWPHDVLPKGENVIVARTHGGERAAAAKGKAMDWGRRFAERDLTFEFIQQWYVKG